MSGTPFTDAPSAAGLSPLASLLRCLRCGSEFGIDSQALECSGCGQTFPVRAGTARMVQKTDEQSEHRVKKRTAESFGYEWERFGVLRPEWRKNFLDYMQPLTASDFRGVMMLDVGTGSGRHSREAAELGAKVVAVDLGDAIDVARRNLPADVLTVQADAERLPFAPGTFDLVASIGVLHHLPDPARAFRSIVPYAKPGGRVQVYLYWHPPYATHRRILRLVTAVRRGTVRMPHPLLHVLCYPLAALLFAFCVLPYRLLRRRRSTARLAARFPLKTYADYPFGVCVNDQFDRFSAPLERRFTEAEVRELFEDARLEDVSVIPHHGWVASGRRPRDPA